MTHNDIKKYDITIDLHDPKTNEEFFWTSDGTCSENTSFYFIKNQPTEKLYYTPESLLSFIKREYVEYMKALVLFKSFPGTELNYCFSTPPFEYFKDETLLWFKNEYNNLYSKYKGLHLNHWWQYITKRRQMSNKVLYELREFIDWNCASKYQILSEELIELVHYKKRAINWTVISRYQELSEEFIRKYEKKVNWHCIIHYQNLSENFMREFKDNFDWLCVGSYQNVSHKFICEMREYCLLKKYKLCVDDENNKWIYCYSFITDEYANYFNNCGKSCYENMNCKQGDKFYKINKKQVIYNECDKLYDTSKDLLYFYESPMDVLTTMLFRFKNITKYMIIKMAIPINAIKLSKNEKCKLYHGVEKMKIIEYIDIDKIK